jgi:hypothetical protein
LKLIVSLSGFGPGTEIPHDAEGKMMDIFIDISVIYMFFLINTGNQVDGQVRLGPSTGHRVSLYQILKPETHSDLHGHGGL